MSLSIGIREQQLARNLFLADFNEEENTTDNSVTESPNSTNAIASPKTDSDDDGFNLSSADLSESSFFIPTENENILPLKPVVEEMVIDLSSIYQTSMQTIQSTSSSATAAAPIATKLPPPTPDVRKIKKRALLQILANVNSISNSQAQQKSKEVQSEGSPSKKSKSPFVVRATSILSGSAAAASAIAAAAMANAVADKENAPQPIESTELTLDQFAPGEDFLIWSGAAKLDKYVSIGGVHHKLKLLGEGAEHIVYSFMDDAEINMKLNAESTAAKEFLVKMAEFNKQNNRSLRTSDVVIRLIHQGKNAPGRKSIGIQTTEKAGYAELTARAIPLPVIFYTSTQKGHGVIVEQFDKSVKVSVWKQMHFEQLEKLVAQDKSSGAALMFFKKWLTDIANTGKDINDFYSRNVMFKKDGTVGVCDWSGAKKIDKTDKKHGIVSTVEDHLYSYLIEISNESKAVWDVLTLEFNEAIKKDMNDRLSKEMAACNNAFPVSKEPRP